MDGIIFAPFVVIPFLVALYYKRFNNTRVKRAYAFTYIVLLIYYVAFSRFTYLYTPPAPSVDAWYPLVFIGGLLVVALLMAPAALLLQKVFFMLFKTGSRQRPDKN